jgi:hypothetical protein
LERRAGSATPRLGLGGDTPPLAGDFAKLNKAPHYRKKIEIGKQILLQESFVQILIFKTEGGREL